MSQRIISTVGTSLLTNARRLGLDPDDPSALHTLLRQRPQEACAESNALSRLAGAGDVLVFLHSDTAEGERCSSVLADAFAARGSPRGAGALWASATTKRGLCSTACGSLCACWPKRSGGRSAEAVRGGIFKFPKGHTAERVFFGERDGVLYVLELCGHDDERRYQALIKQIDWGDYDRGAFTELP